MTTVLGAIKYRSAVLHIPRFDVKVRAVLLDRTVYFPVKAVCVVLGLHPPTQKGRIKVDGRFAEAWRDVPISTPKGYRDTLCLRKDKVATWLGLIDPTHCKLAQTRAKLEEFQSELFAAADRFLWGDTGASENAAPAETAVVTHVTTGTLHVGPCPSCGMQLCLTLDDTGAHLVPEPDESDEKGVD